MFFRNSNVFSPDRIFPEKGRLTDNRMLIIAGLLSRFPTNRPTYTVAERAKLVMGHIMFASKAPPLLRWYPCPACGPLLPCVPNGIFNSVHHPWLSVVIAAFPVAFREAHEAFPLFQDAAGFSVLVKRFLFRRQFHFF